MDIDSFAFLIFVWGLLALGVAFLANSRGRSGLGFFLLSFFLSPILGLIVVLVIKNLTEESEKEAMRRRELSAKEDQRRREHEAHLESIRAIASKKEESANNLPSMATLSIADEIRKLGELKSAGLLSEEEFASEKKKLLS
jgi:hypothetical protein